MIFVRNHPFMPAWVFAGIIFGGCSLPVDKISQISELNPILSVLLADSFLHFSMFALLVWLICYGYNKSDRKKKSYIKVLFLAAAYGLGIEIWQGILSYRSFSFYDLLFDLLGILAGIYIFKIRT